MTFFDDFLGYKHARAKILTVLESAQSDGSNDTHKPHIFDNCICYLTENFKGFERPFKIIFDQNFLHFLNPQMMGYNISYNWVEQNFFFILAHPTGPYKLRVNHS